MEARERILQEFTRQFEKKDCKDITIDSIAENIAMSKRTIYEIFSSKKEIMKESFSYIREKEREKALFAIKDISDPMRKAVCSVLMFLKSVDRINVSRIISLRKNYPEMADHVSKIIEHLMNEVLLSNLIKAQKDGYICPNVQSSLFLALLFNVQGDPRDKIIHFFSKDIDSLSLFATHLFIILRGLSTPKGLKICDEYKEDFLSYNSKQIKNN